MAKNTPLSPVDGAAPNLRTIQVDADLVNESPVARVYYLLTSLAVIACGAGWWWQSGLDGWPRAVVMTLTVLLTIYLVVIIGALLLSGWAGRFIRNV